VEDDAVKGLVRNLSVGTLFALEETTWTNIQKYTAMIGTTKCRLSEENY
jgi:hypothetical protein